MRDRASAKANEKRRRSVGEQASHVEEMSSTDPPGVCQARGWKTVDGRARWLVCATPATLGRAVHVLALDMRLTLAATRTGYRNVLAVRIGVHSG